MILQPFFYAIRPLFMNPKPMENLEMANYLWILGTNCLIYNYLGTAPPPHYLGNAREPRARPPHNNFVYCMYRLVKVGNICDLKMFSKLTHRWLGAVLLVCLLRHGNGPASHGRSLHI